jgi:hypothetical protein
VLFPSHDQGTGVRNVKGWYIGGKWYGGYVDG